jgi:hypothetical protein
MLVFFRLTAIFQGTKLYFSVEFKMIWNRSLIRMVRIDTYDQFEWCISCILDQMFFFLFDVRILCEGGAMRMKMGNNKVFIFSSSLFHLCLRVLIRTLQPCSTLSDSILSNPFMIRYSFKRDCLTRIIIFSKFIKSSQDFICVFYWFLNLLSR